MVIRDCLALLQELSEIEGQINRQIKLLSDLGVEIDPQLEKKLLQGLLNRKDKK